ncbi:MAG: response regulator [Desulfobacterales bacterium]|nr:response regulator [Desulfobacterales bacterium]
MADNKTASTDFQTLRRYAEQILERRETGEPGETDDPEILRLIHELEVYQVELELQNRELRQSRRELEEARNEYYELYDTAPVGFVEINRHGLIERCNAAAARMLAREKAGLAGRPFSSFVRRDDRRTYFECLKAQSTAGLTPSCEFWLASTDGNVVPVQCTVMVKKDSYGYLIWRLALTDVTNRKENEQELENRAQQLARLTSQLTLAEQRERRRLAEQMHDNLQQLLAGARLHMEILSSENGVSDTPAFQNAYNLITRSIATARSLSAELSPPVLYHESLSEALKWLARWMKQVHCLEISLDLDQTVPPIREDLRVLLFQSVRELLFNVAKHGDTDTAGVEMRRVDGFLRIAVRDAGSGFDPDRPETAPGSANGGFGLFTIKERLGLLGGDFRISSAPEKGTTVTLHAPLHTAEYPGAETRVDKNQQQTGTSAAPAPQSGPENRIRILLVDDHAVMRDGLSTLLSKCPDIEITGEAGDGEEAIEKARQLRPHVILMDINLPKINGLEATRTIHSEMPETRIIGLSVHQAEDMAEAIKEAGACAYLAKSDDKDTLLAAIRDEKRA